VNSHDGIPFLIRHSRERFIPQDASVSDQDVDVTEGIQCGLNKGITILRRTHHSRSFTASYCAPLSVIATGVITQVLEPLMISSTTALAFFSCTSFTTTLAPNRASNSA